MVWPGQNRVKQELQCHQNVYRRTMKLFHSFERGFVPLLADFKKGKSPKYHLSTTINKCCRRNTAFFFWKTSIDSQYTYGLETCRAGFRECDILNTVLILPVPVRWPEAGRAWSELEVVVARQDPVPHRVGNAMGLHSTACEHADNWTRHHTENGNTRTLAASIL